MRLVKITKDNVYDYADFSKAYLMDNDTILGVACVDHDEEPMGTAFLDSDGERLIISSLYVDEDERRQGAGSMILAGIEEMARSEALMSVDAYFNEPEAEDFFLANNYLVLQAQPIYQISSKDFRILPEVQRIQFMPANCIPLNELRPSVRGSLVALLQKQGFVSRLSQYDEDLSCVYVTPDERPVAFILATYNKATNCLTVDHLLNTESSHPEYLINLLYALVVGIKVNVPRNTTIEFVAASPKIRSFVEKTIGEPDMIKEKGCVLHAVKSLN